jgi:hypothetical protein
MTRRLITALAVALTTAVALGLIAPAGGMATVATEPTLTLTRHCYRQFGAVVGDGINIRLRGLPPFTPFKWTETNSYDFPAWPQPRYPDTTDADGNWESSGNGGLSIHGLTWYAKVFWSGGTLTESLYVDCTRPEGAITVIPPDDYPSGCLVTGEALQGHEADDRIEGSNRYDLLRGGGGDDSLDGGARPDCLFGQKGADAISDGASTNHIWGQRGPDRLIGGSGHDWIRGGRGADRIRGGEDTDYIFDTRGRNRISCGNGIDHVKTIKKSRVAANCEDVHVRREF